jgi:hypothetical protein
MRAFARPFPIDRLSLEARVLYSAFCAFLLVGVTSSVWLLHDDGIDGSTPSVRRHYRGGPAGDVVGVDVTAGAGAPGTTGPAFDTAALEAGLAADAATTTTTEKSLRQVVETTHFHLFSVPLCLLVVGHLFMMCALRLGTKIAVLAVASLSTLLHVLSPLFVRTANETLTAVAAPLFLLSAATMGASWFAMLAWPLWQMWTRRPPKTSDDGA